MSQLIYGVSALGIVVVFAVSMQRSTHTSEQAVYTNEVLTQLVTIGRDIVDDIAGKDLPFDRWVDPDRLPSSATYPYVHRAEDLTDVTSDEWGGCSNFSECRDIDDFANMDPPLEGERNGMKYTAYIDVHYVVLDDPDETLAGTGDQKSFAKEIVVTVEASSIQVGGEPLSADYSQVITYPRITNFSY